MEERYKEAFVETLDILEHTDTTLVEKIHKRFFDFLEQNKSNSYVSNIDFNDSNWQEKIKPETNEILALIYRDYLVTPEKRQELIKNENKENSQKYSYDKLFNQKEPEKVNINNNNNNENTKPEEMSLQVTNTTWYSKIINFFKKLFHK